MNSTQPERVTGAQQLGLIENMVVQELGWDDDVDEDLRNDIMDIINGDLIEDAVEPVDVVLLWLRDDEDAADAMVDALHDLSEEGYIWLLSPKVGRPGFVDAADLSDGARIAGLVLTNTENCCPDWQAHKVVRPKSNRR